MEKIQYERIRREKCYVDLFEDLKKGLYRSPVFMNVLFGKVPATEGMLADDSSPGRFLREGLKLTLDDLYHNGLLPKNNPRLSEAIFEYDYLVPQLTIEELGELPLGRTDVYFIGGPASGKTCLFSVFAKYCFDHGIIYEPHYNKDGNDSCFAYFMSCVNGVASCNAPQSTSSDALSYLKITTGAGRKLTIVESADEAQRMISGNAFDDDVLEKTGLGKCLLNDNPKALFFLIDGKALFDKNKYFSSANQEVFLKQFLDFIVNKGRIIKNVNIIGVVFSKSDVLDEVVGHPLSEKERLDVASEYLEDSPFMNSLSQVCKKYGVNQNHGQKPLFTTWSIGHVYVGNAIEYDEIGSNRISEFILGSECPE